MYRYIYDMIMYIIFRAKRLGSVRRSIGEACERHEIQGPLDIIRGSESIT